MVAAQGARATPQLTKASRLTTTVAATVAGLVGLHAGAHSSAIDPKLAAGYLWFLLGPLLSCCVAGQLVVRTRRPAWLPPDDEWNLTPYRLLLPVQLTILALMVWIDVDLSRGLRLLGHPQAGLRPGGRSGSRTPTRPRCLFVTSSA